MKLKYRVNVIRRENGSRHIYDDAGKFVRSERCEVRRVFLEPIVARRPEDVVCGGSVELTCVDLHFADRFDLGDEFYLNLVPVGVEPDA